LPGRANSSEDHSRGDLAGRRYAVVGGGISGLAAAWYLQRRGAETHIFEREAALGGRAGSGMLGDRPVSLGGKNIGRSYERFRRFSADHGEHPYEYFGLNSSRVLDGRLVTFDSSDRLGMLANLRGISATDILHLSRLALALRRDSAARRLSLDGCRALTRRYGRRTVADTFSERLLELMLRALTVRVSAAEPDEVPMANVLPYLAMLTDSYDQLAGGMDALLAAAAGRSTLHLQSTVRGLLADESGVHGVRLSRLTGAGAEVGAGDSPDGRFDGVVLATPGPVTAALLAEDAPRTAALLGEVRYFPVTVLLAEYERPVFDGRMRAIVFGPEHELSNAGAYGTDDLNVVRYTFSGRRARTLAEQAPDPERLAALAEKTLDPLANLAGNPRRALVARRFDSGLCAYHPDQAALLDQLARNDELPPGLTLTGDYLLGCSLEGCFAASEEAVAGIESAAGGCVDPPVTASSALRASPST
jgi:oxygen-dependent protoporphyrinogen oxidase